MNFQLNFIPQKAFAPSSEQAIYPFISQETKCQMGEVKLPFDLAEEIFCLAPHMMNVKKEGSWSDCSKITLDHDTQTSPRQFAERNGRASFHNRHFRRATSESTSSPAGKVRSCLSFDQYLVNPANHVITEIERMAHGRGDCSLSTAPVGYRDFSYCERINLSVNMTLLEMGKSVM